MKLPLSWLKDFVEIDLSVEEVARRLTLAGLEVEEIRYVGWQKPESVPGMSHEFKTSGLSWALDKLVVAAIREVMPHPAADRLVLCKLEDGQQEHTVLTGAPNLFEYKGKGPLPKPIMVAYARQGATLYDGHAEGEVLTTLKRTKIRGVESYSMVCSEKELGISDEHEGVIILDGDAPLGMPLADYMGDAVFDIAILPNMARNTSVFGMARELAALTGKELKQPNLALTAGGESISGKVKIEIKDPSLNPRFVLGLIRDVRIAPSPYAVQRRLRLAGMRPINCIVDATNYAMLEMGEPLHAFDFDVLQKRSKGKPITINTRSARAGETLTTLDGSTRTLQPSQVLVCDSAGPLSIAGVMGGAESEVTGETRNVLLEGAAWNYINIRRTSNAHGLASEASYRFSRGIHPSLAETGVRRGLQWMAAWSGGQVAPDLVDEYPLQPADPIVEITPQDVKRLLGIDLKPAEIIKLLTPLEFECSQSGKTVTVKTPPFRLDIGTGVVGKADVLEEIARMVGYDHIPETRLSDELPPQVGNSRFEQEEHLRDLLVALGLQEAISHRLTSPEKQERLNQQEHFVRIANPVTPEKSILRTSLLASLLNVLEINSRQTGSQAVFEIGPVFSPGTSPEDLPLEKLMLALALTGTRQSPAWNDQAGQTMDFFDLKGIMEDLCTSLGVDGVEYIPVIDDTRFHPGKCAQLVLHQQPVGMLGELHPLVKDRYDLGNSPVLVAEMNLDVLIQLEKDRIIIPIHPFPPVLEDIALALDESIPAGRVEDLIRQTGGSLLVNVRLFDVFQGGQLPQGKKSLAYALTWQTPDRTLTDADVAQLRNKIIKRLEHDLGATLRT